MAENKVLIQYGHVVSTNDELDGMRIKVRLNQDRTNDSDLPYAFPLLPKTIQTMPKRGEGVLVLTMELGNNQSQRFYIGPIISQPQFFNYDKYYILGGNEYQQATSLVTGAGEATPVGAISWCNATKNAFPDKKSVALVGRDSEDIELKEGEIDIRCGIRKEADINATGGNIHKDIFGKVCFNGHDPAYIQLKFKEDGVVYGAEPNKTAATSIINMVAGKINMVSTNDLAYTERAGWDRMLDNGDFADLMDQLHQLPWGDKLVQYLELQRKMFCEHTHPYSMKPPCKDNTEPLLAVDLEEELLSKDVRIS